MLLLGMASATVACGGPALGDIVEQEVTLTVSGVASEPKVASIGEPDEGLGVSRASLRTSRVTFEPCGANVAAIELEPRVYELVSVPAPSERITTAVEDFCGLRLDIEPKGDASTLAVEATNAEGEPLELSSDAATSLHFETDASASFGLEPLLLGIDVSIWLADLPADEAEAGAQLVEKLPPAAALYVDGNRNGKLDADETEPIATSAP
jgi:hypothetical protein